MDGSCSKRRRTLLRNDSSNKENDVNTGQIEMDDSLTESIETNLLNLPKSRRLRIHRRWPRQKQRSLSEMVHLQFEDEERQESLSMIPRDSCSDIPRVAAPQLLCPNLSTSAETPILRRAHSTGEMSRPEVASFECPGSPLTAVINDVSGWLTPPHEALRMVDFSSLQLPNLFSDDGVVVAMSPSQQFDERTWNEVLMHHAPGGVLVVLAAVTTHPLLCAAALVAVGAQAWTWQSAPTGKTANPMIPTDIVLDTTDCESSDSQSHDLTTVVDQPHEPHITDKESFALCNDPSFQLEWVATLYPPMENKLLSNIGGFVGIHDVTQFVQVFCSDDAPFNFQAFQVKRGDRNVKYGLWEPCGQLDQVSFLPSDFPPLPHCHSLLTRRLTFEAKTNNQYVGPAYASTTKQQRLLIVNANLAVLESETAVSNVPFGDKFRIIDRWIFQMRQDSGFQITSYSSHVRLLGSCPFAAQIRSQSAKTLVDVANAWIAMAHEALQITEQQQKVEGVELVQSLSGNVQLVNA